VKKTETLLNELKKESPMGESIPEKKPVKITKKLADLPKQLPEQLVNDFFNILLLSQEKEEQRRKQKDKFDQYFSVIPTPSDGNCFFHAIGMAVKCKAKSLRKLAANQLSRKSKMVMNKLNR